MTRKEHNGLGVFKPFLILGLMAAMAVYAVNVLNTHDWLWFIAEATEIRPARMVLVSDGNRTTIVPGHPYFNDLSTALSQSLAELGNTNLIDVGLSDETLAYYNQQGVVLEVYFDRPVQYHASFRVGDPTQVLIPIEGRHAGSGYFFRGSQGQWWFGALRMANPEPLYTVLQNMGFPVQVVNK